MTTGRNRLVTSAAIWYANNSNPAAWALIRCDSSKLGSQPMIAKKASDWRPMNAVTFQATGDRQGIAAGAGSGGVPMLRIRGTHSAAAITTSATQTPSAVRHPPGAALASGTATADAIAAARPIAVT